MSITMPEARRILAKKLPDRTIVSAIEYNDEYLFIAHGPDVLEGQFDPFFSVNKGTGHFQDFSPQDYPDPLDVISKLQGAARTK